MNKKVVDAVDIAPYLPKDLKQVIFDEDEIVLDTLNSASASNDLTLFLAQLHDRITSLETPFDRICGVSSDEKITCSIALSKKSHKNGRLLRKNGGDLLLAFWCPEYVSGETINITSYTGQYRITVPDSKIVLPIMNTLFYHNVLTVYYPPKFYSSKPIFPIRCYVDSDTRSKIRSHQFSLNFEDHIYYQSAYALGIRKQPVTGTRSSNTSTRNPYYYVELTEQSG